MREVGLASLSQVHGDCCSMALLTAVIIRHHHVDVKPRSLRPVSVVHLCADSLSPIETPSIFGTPSHGCRKPHDRSEERPTPWLLIACALLAASLIAIVSASTASQRMRPTS